MPFPIDKAAAWFVETAFWVPGQFCSAGRVGIRCPADDHATGELPFGIAGRHHVEAIHAIKDASPCEARVLLNRAAFYGTFFRLGGDLRRLGDLTGASEDVSPTPSMTVT